MLEMKLVFCLFLIIGAVSPSKKFKQPAKLVVSLHGVSVKLADQVKYLGVLLHPSLKDDNDT